MTDNEKAATFIGWREGMTDGACRFDDSARVCQQGSKGCYVDHTKFRPLPAPDMTDPRNYMKALLVASQHRRTELVMIGMGVSITIFKDDTSHYIFAQGDTPLKALAALYAAEHARPTKA